MVKALSQAEINRISAQGVALLRAERQAPAVLNLQNALALGEPIPLVWSGTRYTAKPLSWRDGLALQRLEKQMKGWSKAETVEEVEDAEAELVEALALFHSFLDPKPAENPFADASPLEVGELLGFFCLCLTIRSAPKSGASRFRMSMPSTN